MFAYKMTQSAVSDSKNHWRMTMLDDPDLVTNGDIGSTQSEVFTAVLKKAAAMVESCYAKNRPIGLLDGAMFLSSAFSFCT